MLTNVNSENSIYISILAKNRKLYEKNKEKDIDF